MSDFHQNLKALREARGITQEALADQIGVAKSTISMYEKGNREPNFETLEALADYFNVNLALLLGDCAQTRPAGLSEDEALLILNYRALSMAGKRYIKQTMALAAHIPETL
ncbi:MAG: helix-turn-helix transcriptional regulator [Clostridia bacterium]